MALVDDKDCVLAKMRAFGCRDIDKVDAALSTYADIPKLVYEYSNTFDCNPGYLTSLLECFDGASILAEGIYFGSNLTDIINPKLVVDCTVNNILFNSGVTVSEFGILGASTANRLQLQDNTDISTLTIGGKSSLELLEVGTDSCVNYLRVTSCRGHRSRLGTVLRGSCVRQHRIDPDSEYGGIDCAPITGTCADGISGLTAVSKTYESIFLKWTQPTNSLYVQLRFRENGQTAWITVPVEGNEQYGRWSADPIGFIFKGLKRDTYYDFEVSNMCSTGQLSAPVFHNDKTAS